MTRYARIWLFFLLWGLITFTLAGCEHFRPKIYSIGLVSPGTNQEYPDGFKAGMDELGYQEGKDVRYIEHLGVPIGDLDDVLRSLVEKQVDLIFAIGTPTALKAKEAVQKTRIPVIFAGVANPKQSGVVDNYTAPQGNITGVRSGGQMPKILEWLLAIAPEIQQVFILRNSKDQGLLQGISDLQEAADARGVDLIFADVQTEEELQSALNQIPATADAIFHVPSSFVNRFIQSIVRAAIRQKLPLASGTGIYYEKGALVSYGSNGFMMCKQASRLAHQIFEGVLPEELPVETAEFFLGVNLRTARAIERDIPEHILEQVRHIIR